MIRERRTRVGVLPGHSTADQHPVRPPCRQSLGGHRRTCDHEVGTSAPLGSPTPSRVRVVITSGLVAYVKAHRPLSPSSTPR